MSMAEFDFVPANLLEVALLDAQAGRRPRRDLLREFLRSAVAVLSTTEVLVDGSGITPLVLDKQGTPMVAVFTSLERAKHLTERAPFSLVILGKELLLRV